MRFAERMDRFGEGIFSKLLEIKRQKEVHLILSWKAH